MAAPATAPIPIPTELLLTVEDEPESPPIGAPSPTVEVVDAEGLLALPDEDPSTDDPGRIGIMGLTIDIRTRIGDVGLL